LERDGSDLRLAVGEEKSPVRDAPDGHDVLCPYPEKSKTDRGEVVLGKNPQVQRRPLGHPKPAESKDFGSGEKCGKLSHPGGPNNFEAF
jgi:hypothetical protein